MSWGIVIFAFRLFIARLYPVTIWGHGTPGRYRTTKPHGLNTFPCRKILPVVAGDSHRSSRSSRA